MRHLWAGVHTTRYHGTTVWRAHHRIDLQVFRVRVRVPAEVFNATAVRISALNAA